MSNMCPPLIWQRSERVVVYVFITKFAFALLTLVTADVAASDWPHWRGPARDDVVRDASGFDGRDWTLNDVWTTNVGDGSTTPIVVGEKIYTLGNQRGRDTLFCLDATTGKPKWSASYECPPYGRKAIGDQGIYRGPSSTLTFDSSTELLYTLSVDGDLHCWDTRREGRKVWHLNLYDRFDPPQRPKVGRSGRRDYGYTTSPLVVGDWIVVEVGAKTGNTIAFDKTTGKPLWLSENSDPAGHTGGIVPINVQGVPCVAVLTHYNLLVMRVDEGHAGKTIAEYPWVTEFANGIATPAVHDNYVVITSGYNHQTMCKLEISLQGARKIWERDVYSKVCTPVIHDGYIYWSWRNVYCADFKTGQTVWKGPSGLGDPGSCIVTADDRLIVLSDEGTLLLMETATRSPERATVLHRRDRIFRSDAWPHVVLANGRLLCKDRDGNIKCFEITGSE